MKKLALTLNLRGFSQSPMNTQNRSESVWCKLVFGHRFLPFRKTKNLQKEVTGQAIRFFGFFGFFFFLTRKIHRICFFFFENRIKGTKKRNDENNQAT